MLPLLKTSLRRNMLLYGWKIKILQGMKVSLINIKKKKCEMLSASKFQMFMIRFFSEDLTCKNGFFLTEFTKIHLFFMECLQPNCWWMHSSFRAEENGYHIHRTHFPVFLLPRHLLLCNSCSVWLLSIKFEKKAEKKKALQRREEGLIKSEMSQGCNGK